MTGRKSFRDRTRRPEFGNRNAALYNQYDVAAGYLVDNSSRSMV